MDEDKNNANFYLKIALCDDEKYYRDEIKRLIQNLLAKESISCEVDVFSSGEEFLEDENNFIKYDVLLLDISMHQLTGMDVAKEFRRKSPNAVLIFITAHEEHARDGYQVEAFRYILKDNLEPLLRECIKSMSIKFRRRDGKMLIDFREGKKIVNLSEICYVESRQHLLYFIMSDLKKFTLYGKLDDWDEKLFFDNFLRVHQSYIVNTQHIEYIRRQIVKMKDGTEISIPKARYAHVRSQYQRLINRSLENW